MEAAGRDPPAGPAGSRRLPGRTPSGLLGQKPGSLQLNSSNTPAKAALPVKRRGSFQQLKKAGAHAGGDGGSHLDSDVCPSIFAVVKKSTHWEKYGTVLALLVADELSSDREAVLQVLSAEGYDDDTTDSVAEALRLFSEKEVYPDIVLIDADNELVDTPQLIRQLQALNPTVAILVLGERAPGRLSAVAALQAGAADFMAKPLDLDELVARVERHVQRQHCIKLEMEAALEHAQLMVARLMPASLLGDVLLHKPPAGADVARAAAAGGRGGAAGGGGARLNSVAETDFEEQMSELSDENQRLGAKVQEMERKLALKDQENRALESRLVAIDRRVSAASGHVRGRLDSVAAANQDLRHKVDELERIITATHPGMLSPPHPHAHPQQQHAPHAHPQAAAAEAEGGRRHVPGGAGRSGPGSGRCSFEAAQQAQQWQQQQPDEEPGGTAAAARRGGVCEEGGAAAP